MAERADGESPSIVVTCEHGGNRIPVRYRPLFKEATEALASHRGYDPGALELARTLARRLRAPLHFETLSRLLIELNRSSDHPRLFSEFSKPLADEEKRKLIDEVYRPYRERVEQDVAAGVRSGVCLHLSMHSFTPVWKGKTRPTDIGLLFDPSRPLETAFCLDWRNILRRTFPELRIHFNLPYRGTSDGFTTALRSRFPEDRYAGIEIEVNQKYPLGNRADWRSMIRRLAAAAEELRRTMNCPR